MTERTYKETKSALAFVLFGTIAVMNLTGLSYINVGEHVYLDFSMIPAAVMLSVAGYRTGLLFGVAWGILSGFTHPLAIYDSYFTTVLSQVVFSLLVVYARKLGYKKRQKTNMNYAVMFALAVHSIVFDVGVFSWLKTSWQQEIPFTLIFVKVMLTLVCYYMTLSFVSKQLHQVYVSNGVKRSGM
jgi:hypothetical protein